MARLMASGWVDRDIADRTIKRRTNQASHPMVTEGDRFETNKKGGGGRDGTGVVVGE